MQDFLEDYIDSKYYLKEKGVKFVTSTKNRNKRYTQINGEIALCQKANQQFNWHGDFVFEETENDFNDFVFDVNEVEEKYYLSDKTKDYVLSSGTTLIYGVKHFLEVPLSKFKTAVLVDRNHKKYPVKADFKGLSLSTSIQEHVSVVCTEDNTITCFLS